MLKKLLLIFSISLSVIFGGTTYYVDGTNGNDNNAGTSAAPFASLSEAISKASSGDSIIVKAGTYTGSKNRDISVSKKLIIKSESGAASTILDAEQANRHFNFTGTSVDSSFKLVGFTLKNGKPNSTDNGGSINITNGSWPVFESCVFDSNQTKHTSSNSWKYGGAIYASSGAPIIRDCTFKNNSTDAYGGALYIYNYGDTTKTVIERTTFYGNYLTPYSNNDSRGGAVSIYGNPEITDCTFDSNIVKMNSSWNNYAGALYISGAWINTGTTSDTTIYVRRTTFKQNKVLEGSGGGGAKGGAVYIEGYRKVVFENCLFNSNEVVSSAWSDSWSSYNSNGEGGAIRIQMYDRYTGSGYEPYNPIVFINNTFVNNVAKGSGNNSGQGGAVYFDYREKGVFFNNIMWGSTVNNNSDSTRFDIRLDSSSESEFFMSNNAFQYYDGDNYGSNNKKGVNPEFNSSSTYPYSLHDRSSLLGAGLTSYEGYSAPTTDITKAARPNPSTTSPDLGAYENALGESPYPVQVTGVSAKVGDQQVTLTWTLNSESDMASYKVYQSRTSGFSTSSDSLVATVTHPSSGTTTSTTLTGLTNKTTYYYLVTAVDTDSYEGSASAEVSATPYYNGPTWYVATSTNGGSDSNEGSSGSPFLSLKVAVDSASTGDSVSIGAGTHQYSSSSYWNIDFNGSKSIIIKGQGSASTILDAQSKHRHFHFNMDNAAIDTNFKVMDLTLKNGKPSSNADGGSVQISAYWDGSAWSNSGPLFQNVNFESNQTKSGTGDWDRQAGGAVNITTWSAPYFRNCSFKYNQTDGHGGAVYKDGGWNNRGNAATFENCSFTANTTDASSKQNTAFGGAVGLNGPAKFTGCSFDSNKVVMNSNNTGRGGAVDASPEYSNDGNDRLDITFDNCSFNANSIEAGTNGGQRAEGGAISVRNRAKVVISNGLFTNNKATGGKSVQSWGTSYNDGRGGAIYSGINRTWTGSDYKMEGTLVIINSTFTKNGAKGASTRKGYGGAIATENEQQIFMFNSIIWDNAASSDTERDSSIYYGDGWSMDFRFANNSIQYVDASSFGDNNVKTDPSFVGSGSTPYALHDRSALIGAGISTYEGYSAPTTDIAGATRPNPSGSNPDLGAYENTLSTTPYPAQVAGLKAKGGDGSVTLTWTANTESDLAKYYVYRHTASFTASSTYLVDSVTTNTHTSTGLNNATRYYFRVSAVNSSGYEGTASASIDITPEYTGPVWWIALADSGGADNNEGSQSSPLKTLTKAIDKAAAGDTIMFTDGTYQGIGYRNIQIYGNSSKALVVTSQNGAEKTILDASGISRHLEIRSQQSGTIDSSYQFIGLTFQNGKKKSEYDRGGSISISSDSYWDGSKNVYYTATPKFVDCIFKENSVTGNWAQGGAISISDGTSPIFESCTFDSNSAVQSGGAVLVDSDQSNPAFRKCTFKNNSVSKSGSDFYDVGGGAIEIRNGGKTQITDCIFENNQVYNNNDWAYGGAIMVRWDWEPKVTNNIVIDRTIVRNNTVKSDGYGARAGGIYIGSPTTLTSSLIYGNKNVVKNVGTEASGAGVYADVQTRWDSDNQRNVVGSSYLVNNTITDNRSEDTNGTLTGEGGGIRFSGDNDQTGYWFNNIIWGNEAAEGPNFEGHVHQTQIVWDYNNVGGSTGLDLQYEHVYDVDPKFTDTTNHVYTLSDASYLIGKGVSSMDDVNAPTKDLAGNIRPTPPASSPDMGAYEHELDKSPYPSKVAGLKTKASHKYVTLEWDANTESDLASYTVYMSTTAGFTPTSADSIASVTTNTYTTADTLLNKAEYYFAVAAVNEKGNQGDFSEIVQGIPMYRGPNWYVAIDGNNDNDGNAEAPFSDLRTAIDSAKAGHTIVLLAGTHNGPENREIRLDTGKQLRITGDPNAKVEEVILDAEHGGRHFLIQGAYDSTLVFKNITFKRGSGQSNGGSGRMAGSIGIQGGQYWDPDKQENVEGYPSPKFIRCVWDDNHAGGGEGEQGAGGAIALMDASPVFYGCTFKNNSASTRGGAVYTQTSDSNHPSNPLFKNCLFEWNSVDSNTESAMGGAVNIENGGTAKFINSRFKNNIARTANSDRSAEGAAVFLESGWRTDIENNILFSRCIFENNYAEGRNGGGARGGAIHAYAPYTLVNSLVVKNVAKGNYGGGAGIYVYIEERDGVQGQSVGVNNTIVSNVMMDQNNNPAHGGGGIWFDKNGGTWYNNIIFYNKSGNDNAILFGDPSKTAIGYLCIDDGEGQSWYDPATMFKEKPKFKNPAGGDFRLSFTSPLIDAGVDEFGGENAPKVDIRNYYRIGTTDIGAYEFGASKYILELADDISPIERDTTYLSRDQEFKVTIKTNDNQGNVVTDEERVKWFISPTDKHVTIVEYDSVTTKGEASVKVKATGITGFKFRVGVDIADAIRVTDLYIIERQVSGAPPPVSNIAIAPDGWSPDNNFTITWDNPDEGDYGREFLGAFVKLGDQYPEYIDRHPDSTQFDVNSAGVQVPEMGEWNFKVWLVDELGNEAEDSASVVTARFDEQPPDEFNIHWPNDGSWVSDQPQFRWEMTGDYPSGIKEYHIFVNEQHYAKFDPSQVNYDNDNEEVYVDAPQSIPDGNHSWHMEIWDMAGNITWANDTIDFGVDITPPIIDHPNPLTTIDAGSTTPSINVTVTDGASGVKYANLHYRRSGSGSGFVTVDLLSGPVSIPGSDVKEDGLEYWIDAEDNVGNRRVWPGEGQLHSVRVRTASSITTADHWSGGIPGGTDSTNYLFFSIPFDVGNAKPAITAIMGEPDEFKYRLFAYNNGWQENPSSVTMGNAYFFIFDPDKYSETPNLSFDFGQGTSTPTDPPYGIGVTPGQWKFFGSPYNFNVSLDNVYTENDENIRDAGSIYTWNRAWTSVGSLQPWEGYIFKSGGDTKLNIDARGGGFGKMAKTLDPDNIPMDANEWIVDIVATTGNARDELNAVGVRNFAEDGYDPLDEFEPPAVMGDIVLRIDNREREETPDLYAMDIRKPNETGHYWDLQVFAPTNGLRTYITFDGLGYIPEEYDVFLINKTTKQAKNLEWDSSYRFANTGSGSYLRQDFRLVIGTKDFVEENNAGVNLYPDAFTLSQNYPNPFNPQTSIMISLEEDAQLDLVIYNLLGEEITRLAVNENRPAGYYSFIWNGRNGMGDKVSTGVYFYHAMIRNAQGKIVLNKTRKMIFLK